MNRADWLHFLAVGPQKTATTWLYEVLRDDTRIAFPRHVKETFFWDAYFDRGLNWYWRHFNVTEKAHVCGEVAPTYFACEEASSRIALHFPRCRIIVTLRDPAERTFSLYLHHLKKGRYRLSFDTELQRNSTLLEGSRYAKHLPRWQKAFGKENVLVLLQDDISQYPTEIVDQVYEFLDLESPDNTRWEGRIHEASLPAWPRLASVATNGADFLRRHGFYRPIEWAKRIGLKRIYRGSSKIPRMTETQRAQLVQIFEQDIAYVEELLGKRLDQWRV